ncbi:MAG: universal stress protein [Aliishimia sp.]
MKQTITHILHATDLSKHSACTMRHAVSLAASTGAKLHVLHAVQPMSDETRTALKMYMQTTGSSETAEKERRAHARAVMAERQKEFWNQVSAEDKSIQKQVESIELVEGYPADVILRRSVELKCDLIIIGAHEQGFTQTFLGTVAKRVLRRSKIPTLVVPYRDTEENV